MVVLPRPPQMFDREHEWRALSEFVTDPAPGARLGVVSGRRRQGKTFLLRAVCEATGGFYFAADEATDHESLERLGRELASFMGAPAPLKFTGWHAAVDALLALGEGRRVPVVIDEFPYLVRANRSLPSVVQNALAPLRRERDASTVSLLLCGSAMSFMGKLLGGGAPLRGRAGLELVVPTLDHRLAAEFWGVDDPRTALKVNAVVGGTPAYRREFARDDVPAGPDDFDDWVVRTVLSPTSPLFREARYLLADEPELRDLGLYHAVLGAIAAGDARRGSIASRLGRTAADLTHPLTVLANCGLVVHQPDAFRQNRSTYRIAEPLITFYHAVMRPLWADLERGRDTPRLWRRSTARFEGNVLGPHVETVARHWCRHDAPDGTFGDFVTDVGVGVVNDPARRTTHEVDVAVFGLDDRDRRQLLAIGEVKWGERMGTGHVARLERVRQVLADQGHPGAPRARLVCVGAAGFTDELHDLAGGHDEVVLVDAADLYGMG